MSWLLGLKKRALAWAHHRYAEFFLYGLSFIESSFFPIPPDVMLIPIVLARPLEWFRLALLTTISSVLGGLTGYAIGYGLYQVIALPILEWYGLLESFAAISHSLEVWGGLVIFLSALTPIPYKVFTIAAGVFALPLPIFIIASFIGRGIRFFLEAYVVSRFGKTILERMSREAPLWSWVVGGVVVLSFLLWMLL